MLSLYGDSKWLSAAAPAVSRLVVLGLRSAMLSSPSAHHILVLKHSLELFRQFLGRPCVCAWAKSPWSHPSFVSPIYFIQPVIKATHQLTTKSQVLGLSGPRLLSQVIQHWCVDLSEQNVEVSQRASTVLLLCFTGCHGCRGWASPTCAVKLLRLLGWVIWGHLKLLPAKRLL